MEKSLVLIKPDAVKKNLIGRIISKYEENNLKVVDLRMEKITEEFASKHYAEHIGKDFYKPLVEFITSGPLCALVLEGENAIERVREINGNTDPEKAKEGTIRKSFSTSKRENCVHASDCLESAEREIKLWFGAE
ncbi:MAG: nucleoside-diphosphate kinase [Clostridium sp.]|uniref:nucleoside-diphosphate kinase n=1 Tax=Clostridium sp. TaxID=1506 RepID=UPI0025C1D3E7|nr:nucleoside-diphosphate kinase [Clostridium sp.]MCF0147364.1 nucleoside-diphosphate kinase [Clostridium sp.]